jgi:uncharacterized protein (DUF169 family)
MALSWSRLSALLEQVLELRLQPVALAFVQKQPPSVPRSEAASPSTCAFWRRAETEVFYASAEDHFNCPLGAMVMGFPLPPPQMSQLQEELGMMCGLSYVREAEVPHVPKVASPSAGIVYGPLWRFPQEPDAVLLWLTPQQAMMMSECCGLINWAASPAGMLGRPACGALPVALAQGRPAQSFGCVGMRVNTGVPGDLLLMVLPRNILENLHADLAAVARVHRQMEGHYRDRVAAVTSAE